tara:strand:+ start:1370 stop:2278 length:909 start_codon:yes stop_codon:yes gene_type:complete
MDVRQLRYFSAIVDAKSFTGAADRVNVAQPALGLQVRKLEEELGVSLLYRHSRGVIPTEAGTVLMRHANAILKQIEQAKQEVIDVSGPPRGDIVLGITPTASALLALPLVKACRSQYPDISLKLFEGLSEEIMRMLNENILDMGFTYNPELVSGIRTEPLLEEELHLVTSVDSMGIGDTIPFKSVCDRKLILPSRGFGLRECVESAARKHGYDLNVILEIDAVATTRDLVESGIGCTVLPVAAVQKEVAAGLLVSAHILQPHITRKLHFGYAASFIETNASRALNQVIQRVVADLGLGRIEE